MSTLRRQRPRQPRLATSDVSRASRSPTQDESKAHKVHDKAAKSEHKLAEKLNAVVHDHEKALGEEQKAAKVC